MKSTTPILGSGIWGGETPVMLGLMVLLAGLPLVMSGYPIYILPQYMSFGIMAMSLGLLWGWVGILSFGQAAFFALGAYAMGLTMAQALPVNGAYLGLIAGGLVGALVAAIAGYFLFKAGVRATYFVLATLALSIIVEQIAVSESQLTGGWNGLYVDRMAITVGNLIHIDLSGDAAAYYAVLPVTVLLYLLLRWLQCGRFGKVLVGIRENEDRVKALGYDIALYKTAAFTLSGAIAGLAGAIYATHANFVSPSLGGVLFSTEVVVWVAIGGRSSLGGALIGGIIVASLSNFLSATSPEYWQLALGIIFVLVIIFFKDGLAGLVRRLGGPLKRSAP
jgi:urea ABC transporter permease protein UrtC